MVETPTEVWIENSLTAENLEIAAVVIFELDGETNTIRRGRYYSEPVKRGGAEIDGFMEGLHEEYQRG